MAPISDDDDDIDMAPASPGGGGGGGAAAAPASNKKGSSKAPAASKGKAPAAPAPNKNNAVSSLMGDIDDDLWREGTTVPRRTPRKLRTLELFAGCGGLHFDGSAAFAGANGAKLDVSIKSIAAVEVEEHPARTYKANYPDVNVLHMGVARFLGTAKRLINLRKANVRGATSATNFTDMRISSKHATDHLAFASTQARSAAKSSKVSEHKHRQLCDSITPGVLKGSVALPWLEFYAPGLPNPKTGGKGTWVRDPGDITTSDETKQALKRNVLAGIAEFLNDKQRFTPEHFPMPGDVEVITGGPPCQGWSGYNTTRITSTDLAKLMEHKENKLLARFLEAVWLYQPLYVVMEEVPDVCKENVVTWLKTAFSSKGYKVNENIHSIQHKEHRGGGGGASRGGGRSRAAYDGRTDRQKFVLTTGHYGCPQTRDRMIFMASAEWLHEDDQIRHPPKICRPLDDFEEESEMAYRNSNSADALPVLVSDLRVVQQSVAEKRTTDAAEALAALENAAEPSEAPSVDRPRRATLSTVAKQCATDAAKTSALVTDDIGKPPLRALVYGDAISCDLPKMAKEVQGAKTMTGEVESATHRYASEPATLYGAYLRSNKACWGSGEDGGEARNHVVYALGWSDQLRVNLVPYRKDAGWRDMSGDTSSLHCPKAMELTDEQWYHDRSSGAVGSGKAVAWDDNVADDADDEPSDDEDDDDVKQGGGNRAPIRQRWITKIPDYMIDCDEYFEKPRTPPGGWENDEEKNKAMLEAREAAAKVERKRAHAEDRMPRLRNGWSLPSKRFPVVPFWCLTMKSGRDTECYARFSYSDVHDTVHSYHKPHWHRSLVPFAPRVMSIREKARIQGFPDHFRFLGDVQAQYKQIGNAVSPQLAKAIGKEMLRRVAGHVARTELCGVSVDEVQTGTPCWSSGIADFHDFVCARRAETFSSEDTAVVAAREVPLGSSLPLHTPINYGKPKLVDMTYEEILVEYNTLSRKDHSSRFNKMEPFDLLDWVQDQRPWHIEKVVGIRWKDGILPANATYIDESDDDDDDDEGEEQEQEREVLPSPQNEHTMDEENAGGSNNAAGDNGTGGGRSLRKRSTPYEKIQQPKKKRKTKAQPKKKQRKGPAGELEVGALYTGFKLEEWNEAGPISNTWPWKVFYSDPKRQAYIDEVLGGVRKGYAVEGYDVNFEFIAHPHLVDATEKWDNHMERYKMEKKKGHFDNVKTLRHGGWMKYKKKTGIWNDEGDTVRLNVGQSIPDLAGAKEQVVKKKVVDEDGFEMEVEELVEPAARVTTGAAKRWKKNDGREYGSHEYDRAGDGLNAHDVKEVRDVVAEVAIKRHEKAATTDKAEKKTGRAGGGAGAGSRAPPASTKKAGGQRKKARATAAKPAAPTTSPARQSSRAAARKSYKDESEDEFVSEESDFE